MKDSGQSMENWKAQFLLDATLGPPVAPILVGLAPNQHAPNAPNSVMPPNKTFDLCTNLNPVVPISEVTVIALLIASYKSCKAG